MGTKRDRDRERESKIIRGRRNSAHAWYSSSSSA